MDKNFDIMEQIRVIEERLDQINKMLDAQQKNIRLHFDNVDAASESTRKMFEQILSQRFTDFEKRLSDIEELLRLLVANQMLNNINVGSSPALSNIEKIISADAQKYDSINENLSAIEELLRLLVANQMLNNINVSSSPAPRNKKILICGGSGAGKSSLVEILKHGQGWSIGTPTRRIQAFEYNGLTIVDTPPIDLNEFRFNQSELRQFDAILYIINASKSIDRFPEIYMANKNILLIVNAKSYATNAFAVAYAMRGLDAIYTQFKSRFYHTVDDWRKIPVVYVHLKAALTAQQNNDKELMRMSKFNEIEEFVHQI